MSDMFTRQEDQANAWVGWVRSGRGRWRQVAESDDYLAIWGQVLGVEAHRSIDRLVARRGADPNDTTRAGQARRERPPGGEP